MNEIWNDDSDASVFELPGDAALVATLTENSEAAPESVDNAPPAPEEAVTPTEAPDADGRPRDEKGRFLPAAEPVVEEVVPELPPELILGKFRSNDELAVAYRELESFKGQQANEIGLLRRQVEQIAAQTAPRPQTYDADAIVEHFTENPTSILPAIEQAYQSGDRALVHLGIKALDDMNPVLAGELRTEIAKRDAIAEMSQQMQPAMAQAESADIQARAQTLANRYPDIGDFLASPELATLAEQFPLAKRAITEGSADDRFSAIESLYLIQKGRATDNLRDTTREVARQTAEQAAALREEGFVASATQTAGAAELSPAQKLAAQWDAQDAPLKSGWNVP